MKGLISQSLKKFKRGCSVEEAADALETEPAKIAGVYAAIEECGADSTPEAIMDWMDGSKKKAPAGVRRNAQKRNSVQGPMTHS